MVFSSIIFLFIFFPITLAVYYLSPIKWRNVWLFIVNLIFYGWGEPVYVLLMVFAIARDYVLGMLIHKHRENRVMAKRYVITSVVLNLLVLIIFKYSGLIVNTVKALIPALSFLQTPNIPLPIGISFYTFQTMSYTIDVYRGDVEVQTSWIDFGTYLALFPQLIAGPIVRYSDVANQLGARSSDAGQFAAGVRRFTIGLGKKVLLANNMGTLWDVFSALPRGELSFLGAWLGVIGFGFQLYFDFSGYSDMAVGLGRMMGFEFMENFDYPYVSRSITEFWRRWHISLGTWFRDYVYIPLGGNRRGLSRQIFNLAVVWALTGIWHGADWTFLVFGLYFFVFLTIEKMFLLKWLESRPLIGHIYTLLVIYSSWVMFQLDTLGECFIYLQSMFGGTMAYQASDLYYLFSFLPLLVFSTVASTEWGKKFYNKLPEKVQAVASPILVSIVLFMSTAYLVDASYNPFLYFTF